MARISGRKAKIYIAATSNGEAVPLPFMAKVSGSFTTDNFDSTTTDDDNKTYTAGLPDSSFTFSGFFDDASNQTYNAAVDGLPRKTYIYMDKSKGAAGVYFYGYFIADYSIDSDVAGMVAMSGNLKASSSIGRGN